MDVLGATDFFTAEVWTLGGLVTYYSGRVLDQDTPAEDHPGTWEALPSSRQFPGGRYRVTNSRLVAGASDGHGNETRTRPGYRQAKETKRGGRGGGDSGRRIVPWKRGNRPEGPRRGKETPGHETAGGTDARDTEP